MPTREQILQLVEHGLNYEQAAQRVGIHPGLAYLIATGLPADGGETIAVAQHARPGFIAGSRQSLANGATTEGPARNEQVLEWIKLRARGDAQMAAASARRTSDSGSSGSAGPQGRHRKQDGPSKESNEEDA